ncbi:MAG: hypothetical protein ACOYB0_08260 [Polynucleobacter sp.]
MSLQSTDDFLAKSHKGNCATFAAEVLAQLFGKSLRLEQFTIPLEGLTSENAQRIADTVARDAAKRVAVPIPGDIALMHRPDGRAHVGVVISIGPVVILHLADTSGRAHATAVHTLQRFGLALDGFYRVTP